MAIIVEDENLGHATAYAYAVSKGYEGTEEEFAEDLKKSAEYADNAQVYAGVAEAGAVSAAQSASDAQAAQTAAETAQTAAESAQSAAEGYASSAGSSATSASGSATSASGSASSASASATAAQASAESASGSASSASASATVASGSASSASTSATNAASSASAASLSASSASASATAASESEANALLSAQSASESADAAEGYAESIDPDTLVKIDMLPTDTASGAIASFPDGAKDVPVESLEVDVEPVQDLHGQDAPYPAGGGKNKFPVTAQSVTINGTVFTVLEDGTIHVSQTPTAQARLTLTSAVFSGMGNMMFSASAVPDGVRLFCKKDEGGTVTYPTITGSSAMYTDTVTYSQFVLEVNTTFSGTAFDLRIQIESGSTATAWAPYSNICPITGWTEAKVTRCGSNLVDTTTWYTGVYNPTIGARINPIVSTITDKGDGTFGFANSQWAARSIRAEVKPGYTYCLNDGLQANNGAVGWHITDENYIVLSKISSYATTGLNNVIVTAPDNAKWLWLYFGDRQTGTITENIVTEPRVNLGTTALSYEPYNGTTYTIPFGQTVYGGKLNVETGVLKVNKGYVDLGTLDWTYQSGQSRFYSSGISAYVKAPVDNAATISAVSSHYAYMSLNSLGASNIANGFAVSSTKNIYVKDPNYTDAVTFKSAMNNVQVAYELATPTTIQLTAQEVTTLLGQNNIWADAGDVEVVYKADIQKYIDKKIAALATI